MLDFTKATATLDIQMPDGFIHVLPPKKKQIGIVGKLSKLSDSLGKMDEEAIDEMYVCVADLMSNNAEHKQIEATAIADMLDFAMITAFVSQYAELMSGTIDEKN